MDYHILYIIIIIIKKRGQKHKSSLSSFFYLFIFFGEKSTFGKSILFLFEMLHQRIFHTTKGDGFIINMGLKKMDPDQVHHVEKFEKIK